MPCLLRVLPALRARFALSLRRFRHPAIILLFPFVFGILVAWGFRIGGGYELVLVVIRITDPAAVKRASAGGTGRARRGRTAGASGGGGALRVHVSYYKSNPNTPYYQEGKFKPFEAIDIDDISYLVARVPDHQTGPRRWALSERADAMGVGDTEEAYAPSTLYVSPVDTLATRGCVSVSPRHCTVRAARVSSRGPAALAMPRGYAVGGVPDQPTSELSEYDNYVVDSSTLRPLFVFHNLIFVAL
ncbi:hypothetical protein C8J57DRAFT_1522000 [Mycena rebaudengoi]|nr:hypothetical protein C8J57DRAFT_1522000 [Mycena rebaudengoi]